MQRLHNIWSPSESAACLDQLAKASNVCVEAASMTLTYLFPFLSWQIPGDITSHANLLSRKVG